MKFCLGVLLLSGLTWSHPSVKSQLNKLNQSIQKDPDSIPLRISRVYLELDHDIQGNAQTDIIWLMNRPETLGDGFFFYGWLWHINGNSDSTYHFFRQAIEHSSRSGSHISLAQKYRKFAEAYFSNHNLESAFRNQKMAYSLSQKEDDLLLLIEYLPNGDTLPDHLVDQLWGLAKDGHPGSAEKLFDYWQDHQNDSGNQKLVKEARKKWPNSLDWHYRGIIQDLKQNQNKKACSELVAMLEQIDARGGTKFNETAYKNWRKKIFQVYSSRCQK